MNPFMQRIEHAKAAVALAGKPVTLEYASGKVKTMRGFEALMEAIKAGSRDRDYAVRVLDCDPANNLVAALLEGESDAELVACIPELQAMPKHEERTPPPPPPNDPVVQEIREREAKRTSIHG